MIDNLINLMSNTRWLLPQSHLDLISSVITNKLDYGQIENLIKMSEKYQYEPDEIEVYKNVAYFPINGELVPKCSQLETKCGFVNTNILHEQYLDLTAKSNIDTIVMKINSPGGAVPGIFEFAKTINDSKQKVIAFSNSLMCSGGYLLAAGADEIHTTPSCTLGSIGCVTSVFKNTDDGMFGKNHIFVAGKAKVYGSADIPITPEEVKYFQDSVNQTRDDFVDALVEFRGMNKQIILDTEGKADFANAMPMSFVEGIHNNINDFSTEVLNGIF